jgi:hypothetical protein
VGISSTVEASLLSIDEDGGLIVDGSKIEKYLLALPVRRDLERV